MICKYILAILLHIWCVTANAKAHWYDQWEIKEGFSLELDTSGFRLPVSIAFVPNPGSNAKDPLYYVAELGGRILVIMNDRTVEVFAENFLT